MSKRGGAIVRKGLAQALVLVVDNERELARLDAVAGDGDHGMGMVRGLTAASAAAAQTAGEQSAGVLLITAGEAFSRAAGGASGALFGTWMTTVGMSLGDGAPDSRQWAGALEDGLAAVRRLGAAKPGDKTMVDTLDPFVTALRQAVDASQPTSEAWHEALAAARAGAAGTANMVSRRGRAARLGERSRGEPDAGAVSTLYLLESFGAALAAEAGSGCV